MEPTEAALRLKLILGKYRVERITKEPAGFAMTIRLNEESDIKLTCFVPIFADVKEGDVLTLYTEVLRHATH